MKVTIKKTGINGEGIGYIDRMPVFVPQALIGEEVEIRIVDKQKRYATAELLRVLRAVRTASVRNVLFRIPAVPVH